ncbi:MAG: hypothetical protein ACO2ZM_07975 [Francisellaceae bacterium]
MKYTKPSKRIRLCVVSISLFVLPAITMADTLVLTADSGISSDSPPNDSYPMLYTNGKDQWVFKVQLLDDSNNQIAIDPDKLTFNAQYPSAPAYDELNKTIDSTEANLTAFGSYISSGYFYSPNNYTDNEPGSAYLTNSLDKILYLSVNDTTNAPLGAAVNFSVSYDDDDEGVLTTTPITVSLRKPIIYSLNDLKITEASDSLYPFNGTQVSTKDYSYQVCSKDHTQCVTETYNYSHERIAKFQVSLNGDKNASVDVSPTFALTTENTDVSSAPDNVKLINTTLDAGDTYTPWLDEDGNANVDDGINADIQPDDMSDQIEVMTFVSALDKDNIRNGCYGTGCNNIAIISSKQEAPQGYFYLATGGRSDDDDNKTTIMAQLVMNITDSLGNSSRVTLPIAVNNYHYFTNAIYTSSASDAYSDEYPAMTAFDSIIFQDCSLQAASSYTDYKLICSY